MIRFPNPQVSSYYLGMGLGAMYHCHPGLIIVLTSNILECKEIYLKQKLTTLTKKGHVFFLFKYPCYINFRISYGTRTHRGPYNLSECW